MSKINVIYPDEKKTLYQIFQFLGTTNKYLEQIRDELEKLNQKINEANEE